MKRILNRILLMLMVFFITACALEKRPDQYMGPTGSVIARAEWPDDLPSDLATVRMTVSAPDMKTMAQDINFTDRMGLHGIHGVPAGKNRTVILEGFSSDYTKRYEGSVTNMTVLSGQIKDCGLITMKPFRTVTAVTAAPADVRAEAGDGKVTLRWNSVAGAESYSIYMNRSTGASQKNFDARKSTASASYTWTGLNNGTPYYFAVTAENSSGVSIDSHEVSSTPGISPKAPTAKRVPAAPAGVKADAGDKKVTLRWKNVAGAESYSIYMNRSPGASKKNFDARKSTASASYTWTGLNNGTTYYFAVTAENSDGESNNSRELNATPETLLAVPEAAEVPSPGPPVAPPEVVAPPPEVTVKAVEPPAAEPGGRLSPQEILLMADDIRAPGKSFVQDLKITFKKGEKEIVNKTSVRVKDFKKSLVIYKYPPTQKGRVILMVDNNMWIYFPGTKKPVRISPAQQLLGQVSNADVARVVYNFDYKALSVEDDNTGNEKLLKLFLKAKTQGAAYGSINLWMKKGSYKPVKAEFYTLSGRLLKTIYYKGYKHMLGKERPTIHEVHDAIKKSEITIMEYTRMTVDNTPDNYFQKTFMQRIPRLYP